MNDPRYMKLADVLTQHSTSLKAGEHLLVETWDIPEDMIIALIESGRRAGAHVHVMANNSRIQRAQLMSIADEALEEMRALEQASGAVYHWSLDPLLPVLASTRYTLPKCHGACARADLQLIQI